MAAWKALLALAASEPAAQAPARSGQARTAAARSAQTNAESMAFWDLYLPLCLPAGGQPRVLAHLGQSIDGYIATANGDSDFINDQENIRHLHRLRALHDAVIVGANTIAIDNPQLTTRHVPGPNPVRVVLDPRRRLSPDLRVFTDGAAATLLIVADSTSGPARHGQAEVVALAGQDGDFDLRQLVAVLAARGLAKLFVEGGGTTVSRFFDAGVLDRLQVAIAPVFTGRGKPGLRLTEHARMDDCPRPSHRVFGMGRDILFDCDLGQATAHDAFPIGGVACGEGSDSAPVATARDTVPSIRRIR